jgi:hypothetical protein
MTGAVLLSIALISLQSPASPPMADAVAISVSTETAIEKRNPR